jgi:alanine racemase
MLTINLDAIASNWRTLSKVTASSEVAAVIKANAYSVGAKAVAELLFQTGCRSFFVTTLDEALDIKSALPESADIYVLGGVREGDEKIFEREKFIPVIFSIDMLRRWKKYSIRQGANLKTAIKVDTGMSRFGIQSKEFLVELESSLKDEINLALFMSHLACADDKTHELNKLQKERFEELNKKVKSIFPNVKSSLANSSGVFLGTEWHFDLVRPGAALYGINPHPDLANPLRSAIKLRLPVLQIKTVEEPVSVGYSATSKVNSGARLAVVAGGYADGINRTLGAKPQGYCCGQLVEAIGRVSMDSTIFDVSSVDASDETILSSGIDVIDERITLDDLTRKNNSLGYEVLTSMGTRYQRVYVRDE